MTTRKSKRRSKARKAEAPTPPAERLAMILKCYDQHANSIPSNPLLHRRSPAEALTACRELATWLFRQSFQRDGDQHVFLMLTHALESIEEQLKPLFEAARAAADESRA
jgi:hypothetical protein